MLDDKLKTESDQEDELADEVNKIPKDTRRNSELSQQRNLLSTGQKLLNENVESCKTS